jgi:hypothetical protein
MRLFQPTNDFPQFANESTGGTAYPVYSSSQDVPFQTNPNAPDQLGDLLYDKYGNLFLYARADATTAAGQCLKFAASVVGTVSAPAGVADNRSIINSNVTTTFDPSTVGGFIACNGAAGTTCTKLIKKLNTVVGVNTQFVISKKQVFFGIGKQDGDQLAVALTAGDGLAVWVPYNVTTAGAFDVPVGISLGVTTAGNSTLIQVGGIAQVSTIGSVEPVLAGQQVVTAAAGNAKGRAAVPASATIAMQEAASVVGTAIVLNSVTKITAVQLTGLFDKW